MAFRFALFTSHVHMTVDFETGMLLVFLQDQIALAHIKKASSSSVMPKNSAAA